jgi:hypothetical protein
MDFACNEVEVASVAGLIADTGKNEGAAAWLLIDAALIDSRELAAVAARKGWSLRNSLAGSRLDSFGHRAPQLVELSGAPEAALKALESVRATDRAAPAMSVFHSRMPLSELCALFAWLAHPRIDGELDLHCRFADTRVLPHLLSVLWPAQRLRVSRCIEHWWWFDRMGKVVEWQGGTLDDGADPSDGVDQMQVDKAQFDALLAASEPDTMFTLLLDNTPELVPTSQRGQFHQTLVDALAGANARKLQTANDRLQFVILSLSCGHGFHLHADLAATWAAVKDRGATLCDQMKQWSDELWTSLESAAPTRTA